MLVVKRNEGQSYQRESNEWSNPHPHFYGSSAIQSQLYMSLFGGAAEGLPLRDNRNRIWIRSAPLFSYPQKSFAVFAEEKTTVSIRVAVSLLDSSPFSHADLEIRSGEQYGRRPHCSLKELLFCCVSLCLFYYLTVTSAFLRSKGSMSLRVWQDSSIGL